MTAGTNTFLDGCSVASVATSTRRTGVKVTYTAIVAAVAAAAAKTAANSLASAPDQLISNVAVAKTSVSAGASNTEKAEINALRAPTASQLSAAAPVVTSATPTPSAEDGVSTYLGALG